MVNKKRISIIFGLLILSYLNISAQKGRDNNFTSLISLDAVKLDIDDFIFFSHEVVGVQKGDKEALMDLKGNLLVPWGKYKYIASQQQMWGGLITVTDPNSNKIGFIDFTGKVAIPLQANLDFSSFNHFSLCDVRDKSQSSKYIIDSKGNKLPHNDVNYGFNSPLYLREPYNHKQDINRMLMGHSIGGKSPWCEFRSSGVLEKSCYRNSSAKFGYGNKYGNILISADYDVIREFTNGRAAVMKMDEFGEKKWGYIDTLGKLVIPFIFRNEPGYFHNDLALVEPTDRTDFQFAYIDKDGKIKIKIGVGENSGYYKPLGEDARQKQRLGDYNQWKTSLTESGYFINGYSIWNKNAKGILLDSMGNFYTLDEFVNRSELARKAELKLNAYDEVGIYFEVLDNTEFLNRNGLVNWKGKILFPPTFYNITPDYYSPYALAVFDLGNDKVPKYGLRLAGVINKEGKFILIREKKEIF